MLLRTLHALRANARPRNFCQNRRRRTFIWLGGTNVKALNEFIDVRIKDVEMKFEIMDTRQTRGFGTGMNRLRPTNGNNCNEVVDEEKSQSKN